MKNDVHIGLKLISEGHNYEINNIGFILVENPYYLPDNGLNPFIVIGRVVD